MALTIALLGVTLETHLTRLVLYAHLLGEQRGGPWCAACDVLVNQFRDEEPEGPEGPKEPGAERSADLGRCSEDSGTISLVSKDPDPWGRRASVSRRMFSFLTASLPPSLTSLLPR